jgi:hypothetical protein
MSALVVCFVNQRTVQKRWIVVQGKARTAASGNYCEDEQHRHAPQDAFCVLVFMKQTTNPDVSP